MLPDILDILVINDDPADVELTVRLLERLEGEWRIGVARDGEEALDYLMSRGPYRHRFGAPMPRLTLLDLRLPKVDGLELLRALRANPRIGTVPVVVLSPTADPRELAQAYQFGANSCVRKPVDFDEFRRTIRGLADYWLAMNHPPPAAAPATA